MATRDTKAPRNRVSDSDPAQTDAEMYFQIEALKRAALAARTDSEAATLTGRIIALTNRYKARFGIDVPTSPIGQALELDRGYRVRPHLKYLSDRLFNAVVDVENGINRQIVTSMPPRSGKSYLTSQYMPIWLLRRHPDWSIVMTSFDGGLTTGWARSVRRIIEERPDLGIVLKDDAGAGGRWETVEGGGMYTVGIGGALTGRGAKVLLIDDPIGDFASAHSLRHRDALWNWWLSVAQTRLEPPYLVCTTMTRWHSDDFVGRLLSEDFEGDPEEWEKIVFPAIAEGEDILGRSEGDPLLSPIVDESREESLERWGKTRANVGEYTWAGMYLQRPAPAKGAIFDSGWWRFWTCDPNRATEDGRVRYLNPDTDLTGADWLDSWDLNFDRDGDYVVGQRWAKHKANRFLLAQTRGRWAFTKTLQMMRAWSERTSPWGTHVNRRLVEKKANGAAAIDVLREEIAGLKPISPTASKEIRARAVTPEIESGNVYLPHPQDPGNEWVLDLLSELRNFPHDVNDDQVDSLTQALNYMRGAGGGGITKPTGPNAWHRPTSLTGAAQSSLRRR